MMTGTRRLLSHHWLLYPSWPGSSTATRSSTACKLSAGATARVQCTRAVLSAQERGSRSSQQHIMLKYLIFECSLQILMSFPGFLDMNLPWTSASTELPNYSRLLCAR